MNKSIPICSEFKNKTAILNKKGVYVQIGKEDGGDEGEKGNEGDRVLKGGIGARRRREIRAPRGGNGADGSGTRRWRRREIRVQKGVSEARAGEIRRR
jgi:hypothetical protein